MHIHRYGLAIEGLACALAPKISKKNVNINFYVIILGNYVLRIFSNFYSLSLTLKTI